MVRIERIGYSGGVEGDAAIDALMGRKGNTSRELERREMGARPGPTGTV
jgi:hypothetical protein